MRAGSANQTGGGFRPPAWSFQFRKRPVSLFAAGYTLFCSLAALSYLFVTNVVFRIPLSESFALASVVQGGLLFVAGIPFVMAYAGYQKSQEVLATLDELTGVYNRRYLLKELGREFENAKRYGRELSVLMIDIDNFKEINDTYGHLAGDRILKGVASILAGSLRAGDILGRYGGDEFLAVLPETGFESAQNVVLRLWINVVEHRFRVHKKNIHVAISTGLSFFRAEACTDMFQLIDKADQAMLTAKRPGRGEHSAGGGWSPVEIHPDRRAAWYRDV